MASQNRGSSPLSVSGGGKWTTHGSDLADAFRFAEGSALVVLLLAARERVPEEEGEERGADSVDLPAAGAAPVVDALVI